ncbi:MAG: LLM class flavin-dependent oxidoreductase [bacterium]|nr:LLM class flavin-dependent oxidoreductase [bacterium]
MVDWGLALKAGPAKGNIAGWLTDIEAAVPQLQPHFQSLWMTDHFFWGDSPTHEAWTVMAYLAARFPTLKIGPMVLGQSYRNPALLAKMAATLQVLSGGNFIMGIGAGWKEDEYLAYGYEYPRPGIRIEQLEDTLEILKRLWTQPGQVTYRGKHYQVENAYCEPKPDPVPPIIVGGAGDKTMRLAAIHADMWNIPDAPYDRYAERAAKLRALCAEVGRDPASIRMSWFGRLGVGRTEAEALERGGGHWTSANAFMGTPGQVVDELNRFVALGCDYFMVEVLDVGNPDVVEMVMNDILPKVGR